MSLSQERRDPATVGKAFRCVGSRADAHLRVPEAHDANMRSCGAALETGTKIAVDLRLVQQASLLNRAIATERVVVRNAARIRACEWQSGPFPSVLPEGGELRSPVFDQDASLYDLIQRR